MMDRVILGVALLSLLLAAFGILTFFSMAAMLDEAAANASFLTQTAVLQQDIVRNLTPTVTPNTPREGAVENRIASKPSVVHSGVPVLNGNGVDGENGRFDPPQQTRLSPIFTEEVQFWAPQIVAWAEQFDLDPNIVATLMQLESCGHPEARSSAGAYGLFQVMPYHFALEENMVDPDVNAARGLTYFKTGLAVHRGDVARTFAGYNGGHERAANDPALWPGEMQQYFRWSTGIYFEATARQTGSPTLQEWLAVQGDALCQAASSRLGL